MKKVLFIIFMGIIGVISVKGLTDTFYYDTQIPNMYITRVKGSNSHNGAPFMLHKSNGTLVYCIDPLNPSVSGTYTGYTGYNNSVGLTREQVNRINLIAKFGYGYGNHTDIKWYGVTQYMIWQTMLDDIYFTDVYHGKRITAYTSEINEINNLIKKYTTLPSFNNAYDRIITGDEYIYTDTNNVLSGYKMVIQGDINATVSGNKLIVKSDKQGYYRINFYKKDNNRNYELYYNANSQNMILPGQVEELSATIGFFSSKGSLTVQKKDQETNYSQVNNSFEGAEYGLYDYTNDKLIGKVTLDKDGKGYFEKIPLYKYYLKEIKAPYGYKLNTDKYYLTLDENNRNLTVDVYDEALKKPVKIHKYYGSKLTDRYFDEENAIFGVYDLNGNLVKKYTSDKEGIINMLIPYGEYVIKQISGREGYTYADEIRIRVDNEEAEEYELYNHEIIQYGNLNITKKGSDNNLLDGIEFELYAASDIVSRDGYVYYHKNELIDKLTTKKGNITYNNLYYGKYYLKEVKTKKGYQLSKDKYYININKDNNYYEIINKKIVKKSSVQQVKVPNTGIKDIDYIETIGVLLILLGYCLGIYYYKNEIKKEINLF